MEKKEKIFLGGSYTSDQASRKRVASYGRRIEEIITDCNYIPSLNLLTNEKIFDKVDSPDGIFFENGEHFLKVGERVLSRVTKKETEAIRGLRDCKNNDLFTVAMMACNISMAEIDSSIGGIFELSEVSQGSYFEIALMLYERKIPVLCLSHDEHGRKFGKMLIGQKSRLLRCVKYNDSNLEDIVRQFLSIDVKEKQLEKLNFRLPVYLANRLKNEAKQSGVKMSEVIRTILEKYLDSQ